MADDARMPEQSHSPPAESSATLPGPGPSSLPKQQTPQPMSSMSPSSVPVVPSGPRAGAEIVPQVARPAAAPFPPAMPGDVEAFEFAIVRQVEWYLGEQNLATDYFLQSKMDPQGWVSLAIIASFRKMQSLGMTDPFLLAGVLMKRSAQLEVDIDKISVRPMPAVRTSTLVWTDPSGTASMEELKTFLTTGADDAYPQHIRQESNGTWMVVYQGEEVAQQVHDSLINKEFRGSKFVGAVRKDPQTRPAGGSTGIVSPAHPGPIRPPMPVPFYAPDGTFGPGYPVGYTGYPGSYPPVQPAGGRGSYVNPPVHTAGYGAPGYPYALGHYGPNQQPSVTSPGMGYDQQSQVNSYRGRGGRARGRGGPSAMSRENYIPSPPLSSPGTSDKQAPPNAVAGGLPGPSSAPSTPTGNRLSIRTGAGDKRSPSPGNTTSPASARSTPKGDGQNRGGQSTPISSPAGARKGKRNGRHGQRDLRDERSMSDEAGWNGSGRSGTPVRKEMDLTSSMFPPLASPTTETKPADISDGQTTTAGDVQGTNETNGKRMESPEKLKTNIPVGEVLDISKVTIEPQTPEKAASPNGASTPVSYAAIARRKAAMMTPSTPPEESSRASTPRAAAAPPQTATPSTVSADKPAVIPVEPSSEITVVEEPSAAYETTSAAHSHGKEEISVISPPTNSVWANKPNSVLQATASVPEPPLDVKPKANEADGTASPAVPRTVAQATIGAHNVAEAASVAWKKTGAVEKTAQA